jgi:hypothetical protein
MLNVPLFFPPVVGAKVIVTVHELPADIISQSFIWLKSEELLPEMVIDSMTRSDLPLLWIVTVFCNALPVFTFPKLIDVGLTDILGKLCVFVDFWDQPEGG